MSRFSSACSSVGSALSTLASGAIGLFKSIAAKAANFFGLVAKLPPGPLGSILGSIIQKLVICFVTKAIEKLAKKLGIIDDKDKAEEVGYRVEEAQAHDDRKKQEDFKSFEEYFAYLKEQIFKGKLSRDVLDAILNDERRYKSKLDEIKFEVAQKIFSEDTAFMRDVTSRQAKREK